MTATIIDITKHMDRAAERTRKTIRTLRDYRGMRTDAELAARTGMGRTKVNNLAIGKVKLTVEAVAAFAAALEVPDYVLSMEPDEALRWVMDNQPSGPDDGGGQGNTPTGGEVGSIAHRTRRDLRNTPTGGDVVPMPLAS